MMCYSNSLKYKKESVRSQFLSLRQSRRQDILFSPLISGRNSPECGHSWQIVRTMRTGLRAYFGPFFVSLRPLSLKQPNHARFGTDVKSSQNQWVRRNLRGAGLKEPRSAEVNWDRTIRFGTIAWLI
jgi:hypothetical protein